MKKLVRIGKIIILAVAFIVVAFPFFWCLMLSFKSNAEIMSIPTTFFPSEWIVSGYKKVLTEAPFMTWLWNSLFSSVVSTAIVVFTSCLGGYIFGKFNFKGKNFLFVCVLITMMVPFQVTMIPTYIICSKLNILNSMSALIIPFMVSGFGIFLCRQFAESIPNDILEAAVDEDKMTLPLALNFFNSSLLTDYCTSMSAGVLVMIPIIIIYFIFQKQFIEGITMTGIK